MKNNFYKILVVIIAFMFSLNAEAQKKVYFLVGGTGSPGDMVVKTHLEEKGYTVTMLNKDAANIVDAATNDIMLMSATISSGDASIYKDLAKPILTWESYALSPTRLSMTELNAGDSIFYENFPWIKAENDTTPGFEYLNVTADPTVREQGLAQGLSGEIFVIDGVATAPASNHTGTLGMPNKNAYVILTFLKDDLVAYQDFEPAWNGGKLIDSIVSAAFVYDKGVAMGAGFVSPERRGFIGLHDNTPEVITDDMWKIFDGMVRWLLGEDLTVGTINKVRDNAIFNLYQSASNSLAININNESGNKAVVEIFDITGKLKMKINNIENRVDINTSSFSKGVYVVKVNKGSMMETRKFILQ